MELQLTTNFLSGSLVSRSLSDSQDIFCSNPRMRWRQCLSHGEVFNMKKPSCNSSGQQEGHSITRRQILQLARRVAAGASAAFIMPPLALAYTNIEDARKAGEKLRDIKEAEEGPVLVSSSGIKFRELERGVGRPIGVGDFVSIYYTISRLNGYYLDSMGYGKEGKNDVGETFSFQYGAGMVPEAVEGGMEGMQVGARRRILVTPDRGWVSPDMLPKPTSFFAERRLSDRRTTQALLIEVELVKAKPLNETT
ncbi:unnamed protein product [Calypogeia fissa]